MDHFDDFQWQNFEGDIYPGSEEEYQLSLWDYAESVYPSMYEVLLLNEGSISDDFMAGILQDFFRKSVPEAVRLVLDVRRKGRIVCEKCTREVAETKVSQVNHFAYQSEQPQICVMQKSSDYAVKKS